MSGRLPTGVVVSALLRRANATGGMAAVLARGDPDSGALLIVLRESGRIAGVLESWTDVDGRPRLRPATAAADESAVADLIDRRRRGDPDLWAIDLDIAGAERFAAETITFD